MKKIALIGEIHQDGVNILKKNNFDVVNLSHLPTKSFKFKLRDVDAIVLRTHKLNENILKDCENLKIVARHGVGYDNVNLNFLNKKNIALAITGTANAITVSEHVMAMFLYLCKSMDKSHKIVKNGNFKKRNTLLNIFELYKKNIFIMGFGRIGKALAKRCIAFESKVFVYDPYVNSSIIKKYNCNKISLNEGLKIADFISLHMPLNNKTKHLIDKEKFKLMKKDCIIVNSSRGGIVKEKDLLWALKQNIIFAAGLDVFEKEPPNKKNPLLKLKNIILSPHNASLTLECKKRMSIETCENIIFFLKNRKKLNLNNIINKENLHL